MILLLRRIVNLFLITVSYLISRVTKRVIHWGPPLAVSIEPNNSCNLHCPECPAGLRELTRARGIMQPVMFESIINQMLPQLSWLTLYFQGEPYMSNHFFGFIKYARSKKIFVATSTNGHFLDEASVNQTIQSGLNRVIISLDGANQESYEAYRQGGDFEKVIAGIRLLVSEKKRLKKRTPEIVLQCLVLRSNEDQLDEMRKLAGNLGVDKLEFKTAQFNDYKDGNPLMPENPKYSRYVRLPARPPAHPSTHPLAHQFIPKNPLPNACFRMWSSCVITWDGKVVPCCFDKDAMHVIGDLSQNSFKEIWRGKPTSEFRKKILLNRKAIDICSNCSQTY
ncbi:MAG: radical SAM/SPASM domain-containing protein [Bacteroidota bacterium]